MNYRLFRLSPPASTCATSERSTVQPPRITSAENSSGIQFLQSWFEHDAKLDEPAPRGSINWNAVLGIVLVGGISASFWAGVGWMVATFLN